MLFQKQITSILIIFILLCSAQILFAQDRIVPYQIRSSNCIYLEDPVYIINANYVVYQHCDIRRVLHPDMSSFRTLELPEAASFALDKKGVYFEGELICTDTAGFELIGKAENGQFFWKNNHRVYNNQTELKNVDAPTFIASSFHNSSYFKDKNSVYYLSKRIPMADVQSFNVSAYGFGYDKEWVYKTDSIFTYHGKKLHGINRTLAKTDNEVVFLPRMIRVEKIDVNSLIGLAPAYSADHNHIYYDTTVIERVGQHLDLVKHWERINLDLFTDGHSFYKEKQLFGAGLDPSTFHMFSNSDLFYDKNGIYYCGWDIASQRATAIKFPFNYTVRVEPKNTFLTKNGRWLIYDGQVYDLIQKKIFCGLEFDKIQKLKSLDTRYMWQLPLVDLLEGKVRFLGYDLYADGERLYCRNKEIPNFDAKLLSHIGNEYYIYKNKIFADINYGATFIPLTGADLTTFKSTKFLNYDKNYLYFGSKSDINSAGIELLAILAGPREGGYEGMRFTNYYLYHNVDGFWIKVNNNLPSEFIGKVIDPKVIKFPEGVEPIGK